MISLPSAKEASTPAPRSFQSLCEKTVIVRKPDVTRVEEHQVRRDVGRIKGLGCWNSTGKSPVEDAGDIELFVDEQVVAFIVNLFEEELTWNVSFQSSRHILTQEVAERECFKRMLVEQLPVRDQIHVLFSLMRYSDVELKGPHVLR